MVGAVVVCQFTFSSVSQVVVGVLMGPVVAEMGWQIWQFTLGSSMGLAMGAISGVFLLSYGIFRFFAEFFREPDAHLGAVALGWVTMGQLLSIPMALLGIGLWIRVMRQEG